MLTPARAEILALWTVYAVAGALLYWDATATIAALLGWT